jgi:hypothetical protein
MYSSTWYKQVGRLAMADTHKIRVYASKLSISLTPEQIQRVADQINERAQDRRILGQISGARDGKFRLSAASHAIIPTAEVIGSWIDVEIEPLDTPQGRTLKAWIDSGVPIRGVLRGVGSSGADVRVAGVDVVLDDQEGTILDDIVEAIGPS